MSVFYVFQGETYRQERTVGYVWSPQKSRIGSINADYTTMTKIHKGDFILHNCNEKIVAISIAREDCREALKPYELMNFDTANAVANLANSAGCNFTGPSTSQE